MNGSAGCTNALIEKGNISKLIYTHLSILFGCELFIARTTVLHGLSDLIWNFLVIIEWQIEIRKIEIK
jgi:hypothetical protein